MISPELLPLVGRHCAVTVAVTRELKVGAPPPGHWPSSWSQLPMLIIQINQAQRGWFYIYDASQKYLGSLKTFRCTNQALEMII